MCILLIGHVRYKECVKLNHIICIMDGETKNIRFVLKIYRFVLRLLNISFCGLYMKSKTTTSQLMIGSFFGEKWLNAMTEK